MTLYDSPRAVGWVSTGPRAATRRSYRSAARLFDAITAYSGTDTICAAKEKTATATIERL
jgi:hypothetical protein